MEILKVKLEEQLLIKYCLIKHLILLKIQFMVDKCLVSMVRKFFDKKSSDGDIKNKHLLNQLPLDLAI